MNSLTPPLKLEDPEMKCPHCLRFLEYRLDGVISDVVFTLQPHFSCSSLLLICTFNQSEYTADTFSSNQNRVDHRKWNFIVIFTLADLK